MDCELGPRERFAAQIEAVLFKRERGYPGGWPLTPRLSAVDFKGWIIEFILPWHFIKLLARECYPNTTYSVLGGLGIHIHSHPTYQ